MEWFNIIFYFSDIDKLIIELIHDLSTWVNKIFDHHIYNHFISQFQNQFDILIIY